MALNHVILRTASQAVPLALRLIGGSQRCNHYCSYLFAAFNYGRGLSENLFHCSLPSSFYHYSTWPSSDESLTRVLQSEIECAQDANSQEVEVPDNFPFKIEDNPGLQTIALTREYRDETIVVEVHMSNLVTGEPGEEGDNGDDDPETGSSCHLPLVVKVSKGSGPCLEFGCTAYPDEISINSLSVHNSDDSVDQIQIAYEGPDFMDLDENLQKAFHKYLEIRGIRPSATNFLHEYMINKDAKEYMNWLKNVKKFVEV